MVKFVSLWNTVAYNFSGVAHYLGCGKKQPKISGIALF